jgi:hypothetical protein
VCTGTCKRPQVATTCVPLEGPRGPVGDLNVVLILS